MGLQYSRECFCGNAYYTTESPAIPSDTCYMPCGGDSELTCGGPWTNSVYIVGDPGAQSDDDIDVSFDLRLYLTRWETVVE